jgi:uncharacterized protein YsxB (DUF464 family)
MIKYQIISSNELIEAIIVKGHANYSTSGTDIVCASVSTAIIMTVNSLEIFKMQDEINFKLNESDFELKVIKTNQTIQNILSNLKYTLDELTIQYPKYLKNQ